MVEKNITIRHGIDPRATADLVGLCSKFRSKIQIEHGTKLANAKSIMGLISLGLAEKTDVKVICEGPDKEEALESVCKFLEKL